MDISQTTLGPIQARFVETEDASILICF